MTDQQISFIRKYRQKMRNHKFYERFLDKFTEAFKEQFAKDEQWLVNNSNEFFRLINPSFKHDEEYEFSSIAAPIAIPELFNLLDHFVMDKHIENEIKY